MKRILTPGYNIILPKKNPTNTSISKIQDFQKKILEPLQKVSHEERDENIFLINSWQESLLKEKYDIKIIQSEHENYRKLVAYYRPTQITESAKIEIQIIMEFLRFYVENGYSPVFNEFSVVYRLPQTDKLKNFSHNEYLAENEDFKLISTIFADTIHFSDGTPENIEWTFPILGTTPYKRHKKNFGHLPHFDREYEIVDKTTGRWWLKNTEKNQKEIQKLKNSEYILPILRNMLSTIQRTELLLIDSAKQYFNKK